MNEVGRPHNLKSKIKKSPLKRGQNSKKAESE
ncbi:uncharacterized protein METZ01_LOCUS423839, partial [marine metagenome]